MFDESPTAHLCHHVAHLFLDCAENSNTNEGSCQTLSFGGSANIGYYADTCWKALKEYHVTEHEQGLTLVPFPAQPEPFLTQTTPKTPPNRP